MCFACIDGEDVRGIIIRPASSGPQDRAADEQVDSSPRPGNSPD